jgi:hypothetical protein
MRLKSEIWVKAYLRRCVVAGANGVVARHGDDDAGAIFIKVLRESDMKVAVFAPAPAGLDDADVDRRWVKSLGGNFVTEAEAEAMLAREARFDSDVWIVEIEDRDGRHFLGDELLE